MSKKISELTEKITQLDQNDLFLVTTGGQSKSVKVSTLEAPLKTYADTKASQAQSAAIASASAALQSAINTEVARATGVESGLQSQISSEITRAQASESSISSALSAEVTRAQAAESSLSSAISSEVSNRQAADVVVLQDAKDYADQKLSDLVSSAPAVLDTLNELAQALNDDANFASTVSSQIGTLTTSINNEVTRAQAAEDSLAILLSSEVTSRANGDSSLQSAINNEVTRAQAAENLISTTVLANTPVGVMYLYAGNTAPTGWLLCDGSAVNRTTYSDLFSIISTSYGSGNGSTTFNLPNPDSNANLKYIIKA
jgi:hypothetical protein